MILSSENCFSLALVAKDRTTQAYIGSVCVRQRHRKVNYIKRYIKMHETLNPVQSLFKIVSWPLQIIYPNTTCQWWSLLNLGNSYRIPSIILSTFECLKFIIIKFFFFFSSNTLLFLFLETLKLLAMMWRGSKLYAVVWSSTTRYTNHENGNQ